MFNVLITKYGCSRALTYDLDWSMRFVALAHQIISHEKPCLIFKTITLSKSPRIMAILF